MATEDIEFRAADLVSSAGSGGNGEKLVGMLRVHYPPELRAALLKRINVRLDDKVDREQVAKLVGVSRVEQCHVRGGDQDDADAQVTYVWFDSKGTLWKGVFPFGDVAAGKLDDKTHVSQKASLERSALAAEYRRENPRGAEAKVVSDPFALADMTAEELVALMDEHPDRADTIKAFERAAHGRQARKTVLEHKVAGDSDGDE